MLMRRNFRREFLLSSLILGMASSACAKKVTTGDLKPKVECSAMAGEAIAVSAARNFRSLRRRGITIRKTIDLLIGTWCIENRRPLLHNDSDFKPMAQHLGLMEAPIPA